MYTTHFGLQRKPFDATPDPRFLWLGGKHRRTLACLKHAISEQTGFLVITGDVGIGKTVLVKGLLRLVESSVVVVTVPDPDMEKIDFFNYLAAELRINKTFKSKADFLIHLKRLLTDGYIRNRKIVLVIDEAHRLTNELLQEIRLLANIDLGNQVQMSTILIGLPQLIDTLQEKHNRNVMQRIAASFDLKPLTLDEMKGYINHRLTIAGSPRGLFTPAAFKSIFLYSGGNPRLINLLCDHAMMTGYVAGKKTLNSEIILECLNELRITFPGGSVDLGSEENVEATHDTLQTAKPVVTRPEAISPELNRFYPIKRFGFALTLVLLLCICGYVLRGQLFDLTPSKTENELAMQQIGILELQSNESSRRSPAGTAFGHEMAEGMTTVDFIEESQLTEAPEFDRLIIRRKIEVPAAEKSGIAEGLDR